jgi:hypothetical protein
VDNNPNSAILPETVLLLGRALLLRRGKGDYKQTIIDWSSFRLCYEGRTDMGSSTHFVPSYSGGEPL